MSIISFLSHTAATTLLAIFVSLVPIAIAPKDPMSLRWIH